MSKKKRLTLNTDCGIDLTKGKDYKILEEKPDLYVVKNDDGDKVFIHKSNFDEVKTSKEKPKKQKGLTKREYFAAKAMQGLLCNSEWMSDYDNKKYLMSTSILVRLSVEKADALIEELNKKKVNEK